MGKSKVPNRAQRVATLSPGAEGAGKIVVAQVSPPRVESRG
jgi:hypothetical protein